MIKKSLMFGIAISIILIFSQSCLAHPFRIVVKDKNSGNPLVGAKIEMSTETHPSPPSIILNTVDRSGSTFSIELGFPQDELRSGDIPRYFKFVISKSGYVTVTKRGGSDHWDSYQPTTVRPEERGFLGDTAMVELIPITYQTVPRPYTR